MKSAKVIVSLQSDEGAMHEVSRLHTKTRHVGHGPDGSPVRQRTCGIVSPPAELPSPSHLEMPTSAALLPAVLRVCTSACGIFKGR